MKANISKPNEPIKILSIAKVLEVDGTHIVAELHSSVLELSRIYNGLTYPIGQFGSIVKIHFGKTVLYAYVSRLRMKAEFERDRGVQSHATGNERIIEADLFGEGHWELVKEGEGDELVLVFERGVTRFPLPQQEVYITPRDELARIFERGRATGLHIGVHVGTGGVPAYADLDELFGKHCAVLGSTGAGKSGAVANILHAVLEKGEQCKHKNWEPRIIILDPHDEYSTAFRDVRRLSTDEGTLELPYWLLDLDETISLLIGKTEHAATSQSNIVKNALLAARLEGAAEAGIDTTNITVDSPIPYRLGNPAACDEFGQKSGMLVVDGLVGKINTQRPSDKNKGNHVEYNKILRKLDSLVNDSRMQFMMKNWTGASDPIGNVLEQLAGGTATVRVVDLSGIPSEVAGTTAAVIGRLLFTVKLWQGKAERINSPFLLVCEEAHRYVPDRGEALYAAAQSSIQRLAKEGRKYGIGLMLVTQRPCELDATVLSQCNSLFVLRITNDKDLAHIRSVLPDSLSGLSKVLSGLRNREALFVGQATLLPSRVRLRDLNSEQLPASHDISFEKGWQAESLSVEGLAEIATRWRQQKRS